MSPKHFFFSPLSRKILLFFEKIVTWKNILNFIFHKKNYIHFRRYSSPFLQKGFIPQKRFFGIFSENTGYYFEKTLTYIIKYSVPTWFAIKSYNFSGKTPPLPKKSSNVPQNSFSQFSWKILLFSKKLLNKKYSASDFWKKKVISRYSFLVWDDPTGRTVTQWPCRNRGKLLLPSEISFLRRASAPYANRPTTQQQARTQTLYISTQSMAASRSWTHGNTNYASQSSVFLRRLQKRKTCCLIHKKTSYVSNYAVLTLLHKRDRWGQTHRLEKLQ